MAYEPAFFEVFLAWALVVAWSRWLSWRDAAPFFDWLPWIVGGIVLVGQVVATVALLGATTGPTANQELSLSLSRWGPLVAVLAALALQLAATLVIFTRRTA